MKRIVLSTGNDLIVHSDNVKIIEKNIISINETNLELKTKIIRIENYSYKEKVAVDTLFNLAIIKIEEDINKKEFLDNTTNYFGNLAKKLVTEIGINYFQEERELKKIERILIEKIHCHMGNYASMEDYYYNYDKELKFNYLVNLEEVLSGVLYDNGKIYSLNGKYDNFISVEKETGIIIQYGYDNLIANWIKKGLLETY